VSKPEGQICPFHADEWIKLEKCDSETAEYTFTCPRTNHHPTHGPYTWAYIAEPAGVAGDSLGLGLDIELPKAVTTAVTAQQKPWVEYGLIESAYALANPDDWNVLLAKYDHTHYQTDLAARKASTYTASKYLARSLGALGRQGSLIHRFGKGTGRWSYNTSISYYALPPGDADWSDRRTWEESGETMETYMPAVRPH